MNFYYKKMGTHFRIRGTVFLLRLLSLGRRRLVVRRHACAHESFFVLCNFPLIRQLGKRINEISTRRELDNVFVDPYMYLDTALVCQMFVVDERRIARMVDAVHEQLGVVWIYTNTIDIDIPDGWTRTY